jgi:hypothetical protein
MKAADFLADMQDEWFPSEVGPWIGIDDHDPPYTRSQLDRMEKQKVIEFHPDGKYYRLTLKASALMAKRHEKD